MYLFINVCMYVSGRVSTWLMLFFAPHDKKLFIWKEKNNSWEETSLPYQMKSARIDSMTWRLYWGPYEPNRGIHSSDVRGNNEMTIVPSKEILLFVSTTGMHDYLLYKDM